MKKASSLLLSLFISLTLFAQTYYQKKQVVKETKRSELQAFSNEIRQKQEEQKAIAYKVAEQNNWPLTISTDSSFAELQRIDFNGNPIYYQTANANAAITTSTNELYDGGELGISLSGDGMIIGEWDEGAVLSSHVEFNNTGTRRVIQKDFPAETARHSTHVAGTLIAGGVKPAARGMAYNAILHDYDWNSDLSEMAFAASDGLLISNHSYGLRAGWHGNTWWGDPEISEEEDYKFGFYDYWTAYWDYVSNCAPYYLIVKCAMNDRNDSGDGSYPPDSQFDCIPTYGNAKNILTVGAVNDVSGGYQGDPSAVSLTSFSSCGPTDDGRIKPDICGNGSALYSTYNSGNSVYGSMSGTSMASPNVAGSLLLLQEYYNEINQVFMKSATLKALAIHTADECGVNIGPDYEYGWGLLNAKKAVEVIKSKDINSLVKEDSYVENTYTITVKATGLVPLKATLVWNDPYGPYHQVASVDPPDPMLVNDLDMIISHADDSFYPYVLDPSFPENAATLGDNNLDNVEQIVISNPIADSYTITITHDGEIQEGVQDFSIIVTGIEIAEPAVITFEPESVTTNSVNLSGEVISENSSNVTDRGFVYGFNINPDIDDAKVELGSGTGVISTALNGISSNKTYHVRAYAMNANGIAYGVDKEFRTTSTTTWNGTTWDLGAPTASDHAVINGDYSTLGFLECLNLTINNGKTFEILPNDSVTVHGDFTNNGTFLILSDGSGIGSLITLGEVNNTGSFNMQSFQEKDKWHYISIPIPSLNAGIFENDYLQYWKELDSKWYEIEDLAYVLQKGEGYSLWTNDDQIYTYSGSPNSGNELYSFTYTSTTNDGHDGANFMGNPYPSYLDWSTLDQYLYGSVYYWNGITYSSWNSNGATNGGSQFIPPGQGFFIVTAYSGSFCLGNSNRSHLGEGVSEKEELFSNSILLSSNSSDFSDEVLISFRDDAEDGFEKKYDAYKFLSGNDAIPELYTIVDNVKLSIDRRPESQLIQLGFSCKTPGNYSISIKESKGITGLALEDSKHHIMHDLTIGEYDFDWDLGDAEERFKLHINTTSALEVNKDEVKSYYSAGVLFVSNNGVNQYKNISIYDLSGRLIYQSSLMVGDLNSIPFNKKRGVYIVKLKGDGIEQINKIIT